MKLFDHEESHKIPVNVVNVFDGSLTANGRPDIFFGLD
jgi:hypothetical protein